MPLESSRAVEALSTAQLSPRSNLATRMIVARAGEREAASRPVRERNLTEPSRESTTSTPLSTPLPEQLFRGLG